jgi:hypothetical protein
MGLNAKHPDYESSIDDWTMMRDAYKGERHVKNEGKKYLPPLISHVLDGMVRPTDQGLIAYEMYKMRAVFPDYVQSGVETLVGILNAQPAIIKLPKAMEYLLEKATNKGEAMPALLRRVHEQQLTTGRVGLLADLPATPDPTNPRPYIAMYNAESIINWDDGEADDIQNTLNLVVLDETTNKRGDDFSWAVNEKFRVLMLGALAENETKAAYYFGVFENGDSFIASEMKKAMIRGKGLDEIPFVFINSKDNLVSPDSPPLLGLGRLCFTIYRSEADYRQTLYLQGQDTLVVEGGVLTSSVNPNEPLRVGAGARIDVNQGGDAKYIGVSSEGLEEQRIAIENDRMAAAVRTGQLLAPGKMSLESGEALKTRIAAQTATLTSVALASAAGLKRLLRIVARWLGEDETEVDVIPNLDFTNVAIAGQDLVQLITAKNLGFPLSYKQLHAVARARGLTTNTFEQEMEEINDDPQELIDRATELAMNLKGNNPLEAAGGMKANPTDSGKQKKPSNKPKTDRRTGVAR